MRQEITPKILYFGTPVVLISTLNEDNTANLAPMSSAWALGWDIALGLSNQGKTFENLLRTKECVLNFATESIWPKVERLAHLTGKNPVPEEKRSYSRFEKNKFKFADLTPIESETVKPPAVKECPLQMEAQVKSIYDLADESGYPKVITVKIIKVYADSHIILKGNYINPQKWSPLIYNFRHYFSLGPELGKSFRSET